MLRDFAIAFGKDSLLKSVHRIYGSHEISHNSKQKNNSMDNSMCMSHKSEDETPNR